MTWIQKENLRRKVNSTETANASTEDRQDFPVMIKGKKQNSNSVAARAPFSLSKILKNE